MKRLFGLSVLFALTCSVSLIAAPNYLEAGAKKTAPASDKTNRYRTTISTLRLSKSKKCPAEQTYSMKAKGCLPVKPGKKK